MRYGVLPEESIDWDILGDTEHHHDMEFQPPTSARVVTSNFDFEVPIQNNFFENVFPSIVGHAHIIDKFLLDPRATFHSTTVASNIKFHDPDDDDPDWKVKQCYLLIIAAATEREHGVENLWKQGWKKMHCPYPDFGRFMGINEFKAFCLAAPYCWCNESEWFAPQRDVTWEVFLPVFLNSKASISL